MVPFAVLVMVTIAHCALYGDQQQRYEGGWELFEALSKK